MDAPLWLTKRRMACNLALLMRSMYGAGKPKAAYDRAVAAIFAILAVIRAFAGCFTPWWPDFHNPFSTYVELYTLFGLIGQLKNSTGLDTVC